MGILLAYLLVNGRCCSTCHREHCLCERRCCTTQHCGCGHRGHSFDGCGRCGGGHI